MREIDAKRSIERRVRGEALLAMLKYFGGFGWRVNVGTYKLNNVGIGAMLGPPGMHVTPHKEAQIGRKTTRRGAQIIDLNVDMGPTNLDGEGS